MGGHDSRVNLLIRYWKQLGRSLLLLAHYTTVFVSFAGRSISCVMALGRWTVLFVHCTVSIFDAVYRRLKWWGGTGGRVAVEMCSSSDTESE